MLKVAHVIAAKKLNRFPIERFYNNRHRTLTRAGSIVHAVALPVKVVSGTVTQTGKIGTLVKVAFAAWLLVLALLTQQVMAAPTLIAPAPGDTLTSAVQSVSWAQSGEEQIDGWWLYAGASVGARNYYDSGFLTVTSVVVSDLPTDSSDIHIRLWYRVANSNWAHVDTVVKASSEAGATPAIVTPVALATLDGSTQTFSWSDEGTGVAQWWLYLGSEASAHDLYNRNFASQTSVTVHNLPRDGSTIYAKLWYRYPNGVWHAQQQQWQAATVAGGDDPVPRLLAPVPLSTLQPGAQEFSWVDTNEKVDNWWLYIGRSTGGHEVYNSGLLSASATVVPALERNGETLYVRLWYRIADSVWRYIDETVTASAPPTLDQVTDLVLVTGQSNVQGSQTAYDALLDAANPAVFAYTSAGLWQPAQLQQAWDVNNWHPGNGALTSDNTPYNNFSFHFAKKLVELDPTRVVGIVIASAPGEGIFHWEKAVANGFYSVVAGKAATALTAQGSKTSFDGILWHQGETDWQLEGTSDTDPDLANYYAAYGYEIGTESPAFKDYYPDRLDALIANFRSESWFGSLRPFICGETKQAPVNAHLMALNGNDDPWSGCVAATDLPTRDATEANVGTHFSAEGLRALGHRYAQKYLQMQQQ